MKNFKFVSTLCLAFSLTGCASLMREQTLIDKINNVGTLSTLDENLNIRFKQKNKIAKDINYDTSAWGLNAIVNQELQASFKLAGKQVINIAVDNQLIEDKRKDALQLKNIYLGNRYQGVQRYIHEEAKKQGASYIVFMYPMPSPENESVNAGYGLYCENTSAQEQLIAYLSVGLEVWDIESQETLGKTVLTFKDLSLPTSLSCDKAFRMKDFDLSSAMRPLFEDLARKATHLGLSKLGLK
ncbi:hypothetical protein BDW_02580 [Bdellovibrio bacteriovorus W]|nr:hypothetical protein BDW_02580 [Bdellovibrio bacteriovorus W]